MKAYFKFIQTLQSVMLAIGIGILAILPSVIVLSPSSVNLNLLYDFVHGSLFLVMSVRPLADLLPRITWIRPLVILRKGFGVFSASIVVSFILAKIIIDPGAYFSSMVTLKYWSFQNLALFAHLADISAVLLLLTSNKLSKRLLGKNWKRIQRLSYVYFYGSLIYVIFVLQHYSVTLYLIIVTGLTYFAFLKNRERRRQAAAQQRTQQQTRPALQS